MASIWSIIVRGIRVCYEKQHAKCGTELGSAMTSLVQIRRLEPTDRLASEHDLLEEARQIFAEPRQWIRQKNPLLGGLTPQECIDAGDEQLVWDLMCNIKYVGQT
jgi:hypothetical protein